MARVTAAYLEARRQQILAAARACFARHGFHQTTMQDICREAQLSPGAVYRYFPGKEDIIAAMSEESRRRALPLLAAAADRPTWPEVLDGLVALLSSALDDPAARDHLRLDIEIWAEALRNPRVLSLVQEHAAEQLRLITAVVRRAQARGEINPALDPEGVARVLRALVQGLILQQALEPGTSLHGYGQAAKAMLTGTFRRAPPTEGRNGDADVRA
jgi:AcrR family transcriptional regulator